MYRALLFAGILPAVALAQPFQWSTFTATSSVVDVIEVEDRMWSATTGGLVAFDPAAETFEVYTNRRGLAMNRCVAIGRDARGYVWAGLADGRITRVNARTGETRQVVDLLEAVFDITDMLDVGDDVFVAANNGIYRFSYREVGDNYRVYEPIRKLGSFLGNTPVLGLAVANGYLYAATQMGLARAPLDSPQLSAPDSWTNITRSNSPLPEDSIRAIRGYSTPQGDRLFVATRNWVVVFSDTLLVEQHSLGGIYGFSRSQIGLAFLPWQIFYQPERGGPWAPITVPANNVMALEVMGQDADRKVVAGIGDYYEDRGGLSFSPISTWRDSVSWSAMIRPEGLIGNEVTAVGLGQDGTLWVGADGPNNGVYSYDGSQWRIWARGDFVPGYPTNPRRFAFDDFGGTWVGCQGGGALWIRSDSLTRFHTRDTTGFAFQDGQMRTRLAGLSGDTNFVVTRVTRGARGDIYITNRLAATNFTLARVPAEWIAGGNHGDPWNYYITHPIDGQHKFLEVHEVLGDAYGRVWIGPSADGNWSYVLDDDGTPADTLDDTWFSYVPNERKDNVTCFEDISHEVLDWAMDKQGYLWVASVNGAYYTQGGVPRNLNQLRFICLMDLPVGNRVNAVHVDAHDNKWFGTDGGVAVLDRNFTWIHVFKTATSLDYRSDLCANDARAITSNPLTGDVWIGTSDGLSRLSTPYLSTGGDLGDLWPYPNPFRADGTQRLFIDHRRLGGRFDDLRILTLSGRLVRQLGWNDIISPSVGWNGRNEDGQLVAGGVYLLVATSVDGKSAVGKVAVLGR